MSVNTKIITSFEPTLKTLLSQSNFFIRKYIYDFINRNSNYISWKVMDFWCWESPYKPLFKYKEYVWLDISESWHDNSNNINIVFFDWTKIPFQENYFDSFISTEVFEHVFDIDTTLSEIHRTLKEGWYWIITLPFYIEEHEKPYDFARYTSFWLKYLFNTKGFEIIKHEKSWSYWKVIVQWVRNYIWLFFSSEVKIINIILKILFVFPLHIFYLFLYFIIPNINKDLYFNHLLVVRKIKDNL